MTQEDKELLLVDLCARLPYGVKVKYAIPTLLISVKKDSEGIKIITESTYSEHSYNIEDIKPYLRPMSSMTEEDKKKYSSVVFKHEFYNGDEENILYYDDFDYLMDWLNAHHFDYRGLIEKGLAIRVTLENNPYKE